MNDAHPIAHVNDVALNRSDEAIDEATLRQRACTELLRQAAQRAGLLSADDEQTPDGVLSTAAADAIEQLLDQALQVPEPSDSACRRHYEAQSSAFGADERVRLRHLLFAVTPGVDVDALRRRAEALLIELRCAAPDSPAFGEAAARWSNCPSGADGGELGWLTRGDCAPEFAREIFGRDAVGVLPQLVHSRFGFHVVEVLERRLGRVLPYDEVLASVATSLRRQAWINALRQYLQLLAGAARLDGVRLDAADTPLVQ